MKLPLNKIRKLGLVECALLEHYHRAARKLGLVVSTVDTLSCRSLVHHTPTGLEVNVYAKRPMCYRRFLQRFKKLNDRFPNPVDLSHLF